MHQRLKNLLRPNCYTTKISSISFDSLSALGIKGIIVDLDNTLTAWGDEFIAPETNQWLATAQSKAFRLCMVSNNSGARVPRMASTLGIPHVANATKPRRRAFIRGMQAIDTLPKETAMIGDQIFTDVFGANRLGIYTILVSPISDQEFIGTRLMRIPEKYLLKRLIRKKRNE